MNNLVHRFELGHLLSKQNEFNGRWNDNILLINGCTNMNYVMTKWWGAGGIGHKTGCECTGETGPTYYYFGPGYYLQPAAGYVP